MVLLAVSPASAQSTDTWTTLMGLGLGDPAYFTSVSMAPRDTSTAWAVDNAPQIRKSDGTQWQAQTQDCSFVLPTPPDCPVLIDPSNWPPETVFNALILRGVAVDSSTAWVVGSDGTNGKGTVLKTEDGVHWACQLRNAQYSIVSVTALDTNNAWAVGLTHIPRFAYTSHLEDSGRGNNVAVTIGSQH